MGGHDDQDTGHSLAPASGRHEREQGRRPARSARAGAELGLGAEHRKGQFQGEHQGWRRSWLKGEMGMEEQRSAIGEGSTMGKAAPAASIQETAWK